MTVLGVREVHRTSDRLADGREIIFFDRPGVAGAFIGDALPEQT